MIDRDTREAVTDVLVRYATGIDRRDWSLFRSCFTDDVDADYGDIGHWRGADELTEWMRRTHEPCGHTLHRLSNIALTPDGDGVAARSYVDALVMAGDDRNGSRGIGYYDDRFLDSDAGWKIARRRFTLVVIETV